MARPSRIEALAKLLRDHEAVQAIGSSIVRDALVEAARIGGVHPRVVDDPPWDDAWADAGDSWENHWGDSGDPTPNWSDSDPGWTNVWTQGWTDSVASMRIFAERALPIFSHQLSAEEKKLLVELKILSK